MASFLCYLSTTLNKIQIQIQIKIMNNIITETDFYLCRVKTINKSVIGYLYDMHSDESWITLENDNYIIPTGTFNFRLRQSPKFGLTPYLYNVPDREWILIHTGNKATDSQGCILIGELQDNDTILKSRIGFERLMKRLVPNKDYTIKIEWQLF